MSQRPVWIEATGRYDLNQQRHEPRAAADRLLPAGTGGGVAEEVFGPSPGWNQSDIDILQVYDSFSVHVPLALEGYGYCGVGEAGRYMAEQGIGLAGKLPTNTSGGHLSETYMQGWAHQIECVHQIRGVCGQRQVERARRAHYSSDVAGKAVSIIYGRD